MISQYKSLFFLGAFIGCFVYFFRFWLLIDYHDLRLNLIQDGLWIAFFAYTAGTGAVFFGPYWGPVRPYNLIPLQSIRAYLTGNLSPYEGAEAFKLGAYILLFNLLIFVPLCVFLLTLFGVGRKWYSMFALSTGIAVIIELLQYFIGRTADIDDILLRVLGCMFAWAVYRIIQHVRKKTIRKITNYSND